MVRVAQRKDDSETGLLISILAGFPDRVARRRTGSARGEAELLLALGGSARLASTSVVRDAQWLVAVDVEQRQRSGGQPLVRLASRIEPDWLIDLFPDALVEESGLQWNEQQQRVEQVSALRYESLVLDEHRTLEIDSDAATAMLCQRAMAAGPSAFAEPAAIEQLVARVALVRTAIPEAAIPEVGEAQVLAALEASCVGKHSFAQVRRESLVDLLRTHIGYAATRVLDEGAPLQIRLPGGRRLRVCYELGKEPYIASYLQDFFGMEKGPALARGRVALILHLWAPSRRVVQVTRDLRSFWKNHYPGLRRSLSRRYPRHYWPEDPLAARPPRPSGRRR
jgi:ATP-dependent helicase HrpB